MRTNESGRKPRASCICGKDAPVLIVTQLGIVEACSDCAQGRGEFWSEVLPELLEAAEAAV